VSLEVGTAAKHVDVFLCDVLRCILIFTPLRCYCRRRRALARHGSAAPACCGCVHNAYAEQRQHARSRGTFARYDDVSTRVTRAVAGDGGRKSCTYDHGGQGVVRDRLSQHNHRCAYVLFWSRSA
jgi:hypothetical protein